MPKVIYTDRDIDDLVRQGVKELVMTDEVYLTDLARERAEKKGLSLRASQANAPASEPGKPTAENSEGLIRQVKADVVAKLGPEVDAALIERIVRRVVGQLEVGS